MAELGPSEPLLASLTSVARRLEQSISLSPSPSPVATYSSVTSGPFRAFFVHDTDNHELNYAMPLFAIAPADFTTAIQNLQAMRNVYFVPVGSAFYGFPMFLPIP